MLYFYFLTFSPHFYLIPYKLLKILWFSFSKLVKLFLILILNLDGRVVTCLGILEMAFFYFISIILF